MSGSLLWSQITLSCVYPFGFPDPTGVNRVGSQAYLSETRASSQVKILLSVSNVIFHPPDVPLKASHTQKPRNFKLSLGSTDASYSLQVKEDQSWALMVPNGILFLRADSLQWVHMPRFLSGEFQWCSKAVTTWAFCETAFRKGCLWYQSNP